MSKISEEFWVSNEHLDKIKNNEEGAIIIRNKDESCFSVAVINKAVNKITISYEIDREVTIKESDLEKAFKDISISGHSLIDMGVMDKVKKKLFGGGENE